MLVKSNTICILNLPKGWMEDDPFRSRAVSGGRISQTAFYAMVSVPALGPLRNYGTMRARRSGVRWLNAVLRDTNQPFLSGQLAVRSCENFFVCQVPPNYSLPSFNNLVYLLYRLDKVRLCMNEESYICNVQKCIKNYQNPLQPFPVFIL